jgi:hypothetical protein
MAIHEGFYNSILNAKDPFKEPWEKKSGMEVEDFITRNLIKDGNYDTDTEDLTLVRGDNSELKIKVSAQVPQYLYGIILYGIRLDGKVHNGNELLM